MIKEEQDSEVLGKEHLCPSQFFIDNRERAEEWIDSNAPDYVISVIQEMTYFIEKTRQKYSDMKTEMLEKENDVKTIMLADNI